MKDDLLTEMLCTRLLHDMAGPISAVNNGLDFLFDTDSKEMQKQAEELLRFSSMESFAKLRTYRIAYGMANSVGNVDFNATKDTVEQFFEHNKINIQWADNASDRITDEVQRLLLNMILTVADFLVYGGNILVEYSLEKNLIKILGTNEKIKIPEGVSEIINNEKAVEISPFNVPAHYIVFLAEKKNIDLSFCVSEGKVEFIASQ